LNLLGILYNLIRSCLFSNFCILINLIDCNLLIICLDSRLRWCLSNLSVWLSTHSWRLSNLSILLILVVWLAWILSSSSFWTYLSSLNNLNVDYESSFISSWILSLVKSIQKVQSQKFDRLINIVSGSNLLINKLELGHFISKISFGSLELIVIEDTLLNIVVADDLEIFGSCLDNANVLLAWPSESVVRVYLISDSWNLNRRSTVSDLTDQRFVNKIDVGVAEKLTRTNLSVSTYFAGFVLSTSLSWDSEDDKYNQKNDFHD